MEGRFCSMAFSGLRQFQGWRLDAACLVDLLGHLEGRFQFGAAVLLHELVALGLLFGFGLREREVERSEEHTSELQSLMRISYAVFCLKKKTPQTTLQEQALEAKQQRQR